jgi:hypothetical protein
MVVSSKTHIPLNHLTVTVKLRKRRYDRILSQQAGQKGAKGSFKFLCSYMVTLGSVQLEDWQSLQNLARVRWNSTEHEYCSLTNVSHAFVIVSPVKPVAVHSQVLRTLTRFVFWQLPIDSRHLLVNRFNSGVAKYFSLTTDVKWCPMKVIHWAHWSDWLGQSRPTCIQNKNDIPYARENIKIIIINERQKLWSWNEQQGKRVCDHLSIHTWYILMSDVCKMRR